MTHTRNNKTRNNKRRKQRHHWPPVTDPHYTTMKVAEAVDEAWYGAGRPCSDDAIPLGVVAALALFRNAAGGVAQMIPGPDGGHPANMQIMCRGRDMPVGVDIRDFLMACPDYWITQFLKEVWQFFWIIRPELAMHCGPLANWLNGEEEPDKHIGRACARVARAAIKAGLLNECGGGWALAQLQDVLGVTYTNMRSGTARRGRGEFYTPPAICKMMAMMSLMGNNGKMDLQPGMSIMEPSAGTGGMFLGAMQAMVEDGLDPADYRWFANDISEVPVAALAVNCHIWGLGPCVVLSVADSLANPDWQHQAIRDQIAAIEHRDALWKGAQFLAILRQLEHDAKPTKQEPLPDWFAELVGIDEDAMFQVTPDVELPPARRTGNGNGNGSARKARLPAAGEDTAALF